jgi:predicted DNA-binding protein
MEEKKNKTSEANIRASIKWQKENYVRIPLDVYPEQKERIKEIAKSHGYTVGAFIKEAIAEKIARLEEESAAL